MALVLRGELSGWATMKKASGGGWKQRYLNLEGAELAVYSNNFMTSKTRVGEVPLEGALVLPCRFAGAAPTPAGAAVASGLVLRSAQVGEDFFITRPDAEKGAKDALKAKKKEDKAAAKVAAKAAKVVKEAAEKAAKAAAKAAEAGEAAASSSSGGGKKGGKKKGGSSAPAPAPAPAAALTPAQALQGTRFSAFCPKKLNFLLKMQRYCGISPEVR